MSATRTALVTGCSGQDGGFMAQLLKSEGYVVVGTTRPGSGKPAQVAPSTRGSSGTGSTRRRPTAS